MTTSISATISTSPIVPAADVIAHAQERFRRWSTPIDAAGWTDSYIALTLVLCVNEALKHGADSVLLPLTWVENTESARVQKSCEFFIPRGSDEQESAKNVDRVWSVWLDDVEPQVRKAGWKCRTSKVELPGGGTCVRFILSA